jgi:hypothetical protein
MRISTNFLLQRAAHPYTSGKGAEFLSGRHGFYRAMHNLAEKRR